MTKIPYNTERAVPSAQGFNSVPVAVADTSAVPEATAKLGQSLMKVGEAGLQIKDRQDKFNYSMAYSKFLQKSIDFQNNLEQDPDYINAPQKYKENLAQFKEDALKELGSNNYAENLKQQMNLYESKNYGQVLDTVVKKQTAAQLAATDRQVEDNFEAFSRTKDPQARFALLASSVTAFSNAIPDSDPNKAIKVQDFTDKIEKRGAMLDLMQRSPSEQIRLLDQENVKSGSNITKYLSPEERLNALDKAKTQLKQDENEAERLRKKAEQKNKQTVDDFLADQAAKGVKWNDLPYNIQLKASKQDQNTYNKILKRRDGEEINEEDLNKNFQNYEDLYLNNPYFFSKISRAELIANVADDKRQMVIQWQEKARNNMAPDSILRQNNAIKSATLRNIGLKENSQKAVMFKTAYDNEINAFTLHNKRPPSFEEAQKISNNLVTQAAFDKGFLSFERKKYLFEDEAKNVVVPDDFKIQVLQMRKDKGYTSPVDENYFKKLYLENLKKQ